MKGESGGLAESKSNREKTAASEPTQPPSYSSTFRPRWSKHSSKRPQEKNWPLQTGQCSMSQPKWWMPPSSTPQSWQGRPRPPDHIFGAVVGHGTIGHRFTDQGDQLRTPFRAARNRARAGHVALADPTDRHRWLPRLSPPMPLPIEAEPLKISHRDGGFQVPGRLRGVQVTDTHARSAEKPEGAWLNFAAD